MTLRLAIDRGTVEALHALAKDPWILNREMLKSPVYELTSASAGSVVRHPQNLFPVSSTLEYELHSEVGHYAAREQYSTKGPIARWSSQSM